MILTPIQKQPLNLSYKKQNLKTPKQDGVVTSCGSFKQPSPELFKAYNNIKSLNFTGKLDPERHIKAKVQRNLSGEFWGNVYGIDYMSSYRVSNAVRDFIENAKEPSDKILKEINRQKSVNSNFMSLLITNEPVKKPEDFALETKQIFKDLKIQMFELNKTFEQVGFNLKEVKLFNKFVADTFVTLYLMGFPDAISHAGQVARKNVVEAYKMKASNEDILKSAMVGWLHDPKLKPNVSWSNLATHPIVGGAIAIKVLDSYDFDKMLTNYLPDQKAVSAFKDGIIESLFVNNDSAFVLENVVLNKPPFPVPNPENGVADKDPSISNLAKRRLKAPSEGLKPESITSSVLKNIKGISFDTGIIALKGFVFKNICKDLSSKYPVLMTKSSGQVFSDILNGKITDDALINDLNKAIKERSGSTKSLKIAASTLFCHHDEVTSSGKIPSLALVISDPLLLSPHKVLLGGTQNTPVGRIVSFLHSFNANVESVPLQAKENALIWQVDLYRSMLAAADELSSQNNLQAFIEQHKAESFEEQLQLLTQILTTSSTWGEFADFEINGSSNDKLTHMSSVIAKHYKQATEESPGMFNVEL